MRTTYLVLILLGITTPAAAETFDVRDVAPRSEDTAFALSLGGELASLAILTAPLVIDAVRGGCDLGDAAIDITSRRCDIVDQQVVPGMVIAGAVGALVAPSFGHWYAGRRWTRGMELRLAGLAIATVGSFAVTCWDGDDESCQTQNEILVPAVATVGVLTFLAGTVHDIATVRRAVRTRNARVRDLMLAPTTTAHGAGLVLAGRF